jgi:hypothetical protein
LALGEALTQEVRRPVAEAIGLSESLARQVVRAIAESLGLAEDLAAVRIAIFFSEVAETVGLTETLHHLVQRATAETLEMTEVLARGARKTFSDTVGLAENLATLKTLLRSMADALSLAEAITTQTKRAVAESLALSEQLQPQTRKLLADAAVLVDASARQVGRAVAETVGFSENLAAARLVLVDVAETIALLETFRLVAQRATTSETLALLETLAREAEKTFAAALGLSEALASMKVAIRDVTEVLSLAEVITTQVDKATAESVALSEQLQPQTRKLVADTLAQVENLTRGRVFAEAVGVAENLTAIKTIFRDVAETTVSLAESLSRHAGRQVVELLELTEDLVGVRVKLLTIAESLTPVEVLEREKRTGTNVPSGVLTTRYLFQFRAMRSLVPIRTTAALAPARTLKLLTRVG